MTNPIEASALTIIIPYFKRAYFRATLESIRAQTDRRFRLLVVDDASPEDPAEILEEFRADLDITYHRFEENLGSRLLAAHWNRCVRLSTSEWVWLFSDDDLMSPECVASFWKDVSDTGSGFDLYRFNTTKIDENSVEIGGRTEHPSVEQSRDLVAARLSEGRVFYLPEHIFRRDAFERAGGFIDFPVAWFSDDASWISFSERTGIRTVPYGIVSWRISPHNLSGSRPDLVDKKLSALRQYVRWLKTRFPDAEFHRTLGPAAASWLQARYQSLGGAPTLMGGIVTVAAVMSWDSRQVPLLCRQMARSFLTRQKAAR